MKIVVIGGSGLIGKKLIPLLRGRGHEAVSASPSSGVNAITGEGLGKALAGADVVVDVTNAPSWEDKAVLEFFETSTRNILSAEAAAEVKHHVALSVVGADRMPSSGYMRDTVVQDTLIKANQDDLNDCELLVGAFTEAVDKGLPHLLLALSRFQKAGAVKNVTVSNGEALRVLGALYPA